METAIPMAIRVADLIAELRSLGREGNRAGMAHYGINVENAFGVSVYELRAIAKRLKTDHKLALALWKTGNREARILACFVDDPAQVTGRQLEAWVGDFDSWDVCDQATTSLFDQTEFAWSKAVEWAVREGEWVKRAAGPRGGDPKTRSARWVAADALRELTSEKRQARLKI